MFATGLHPTPNCAAISPPHRGDRTPNAFLDDDARSSAQWLAALLCHFSRIKAACC